MHFLALDTELTVPCEDHARESEADAVLSDLGGARVKVPHFLFFLASILAGFNVGDLVFEVMVHADTTRCSGCRTRSFLLSHAGYGLLHQGRHPLSSCTMSLYTMAHSVCTSLQTLDAGRETTVAVSTIADPTVKGPK